VGVGGGGGGGGGGGYVSDRGGGGIPCKGKERGVNNYLPSKEPSSFAVLEKGCARRPM